MAVELILPRVDMDMSEGKIARWYVQDGDAVTKGQLVFEIETDKATMEIEAPADGIVHGVDGEVGVTMPVGRIVGWILGPGETMPRAASSAPATIERNADSSAPSAPRAQISAGGAPDQPSMPDAKSRPARFDAQAGAASAVAPLRATPLARSIARGHAIDLRSITGSGPDGRIVAADVSAVRADGAPAASSPDRLNLHWFSRGQNAPVVLLHGFGTSLGSWRPLSQQLEDLPVAGIDLPNHGKSPRLSSPDLASVATAVLRRLDEEPVGPVHLVGHSMGGGAALALAGMLGSRLLSLTLIAPLSLGPEINGAFIQGLVRASREESLRPWLAQLFGDTDRLSGSFVATAWKELESPKRREGLADMADRLLPDGTQVSIQRAALLALKVPVKVIWGTLDRVVPYHQSAGLPARVALHSMAGIGHLPHVEATDTVAALVREQVAAARAGGR